MDGMRTVALSLRDPTPRTRTPLLQGGRHRDPAKDEPRRNPLDLPDDPARSRRSLEEARGARQTEEGNRKSHRRSRGELTRGKQYRSSFGFFLLCIFSYLPSCEFGVLDVQDHRVGVTVPQAAVRLQPRKQLGVFDQALLPCQCLEIFRILASLGLDVVYVCLVCHRFALAPVRVVEARSTPISALARQLLMRRGRTSQTLAAPRGAPLCLANPSAAVSWRRSWLRESDAWLSKPIVVTC